jgi:outer membrane protein TolC
MVSARMDDARRAMAASQEAYDVMNARYKGGLATWLDVLQVEDRLIQARLAVAGLEALARNADIALVRALGGGFAPADANLVQGNTHG